MFYSDLFDLSYEAVGQCDSRLEIIEDWQEEFKRGVLYYMQDGRVRGVLLVDIWEKVEEARALIEAGTPEDTTTLRGRIHG